MTEIDKKLQRISIQILKMYFRPGVVLDEDEANSICDPQPVLQFTQKAFTQECTNMVTYFTNITPKNVEKQTNVAFDAPLNYNHG